MFAKAEPKGTTRGDSINLPVHNAIKAKFHCSSCSFPYFNKNMFSNKCSREVTIIKCFSPNFNGFR